MSQRVRERWNELIAMQNTQTVHESVCNFINYGYDCEDVEEVDFWINKNAKVNKN